MDGIPHVAFSETYLSKLAGRGQPLKQGWLIKRACGANSTKGLGLKALGNHWKQRWFLFEVVKSDIVLSETKECALLHILSYWSTQVETSALPHQEPLGIACIEGALVKSLPEDSNRFHKHPSAFEVVLATARPTLYLQPPDGDAQTSADWICALNCTSRKPYSDHTRTVTLRARVKSDQLE